MPLPPKSSQFILLGVVLSGLCAGILLWFLEHRGMGRLCWACAIVICLVPLLVENIKQLLRKEFGVDLIALIAMGAALLLGEYLAGAVVALMLTGGQALEAFADSRARRELTALLQRAPRVVHRYEQDTLTSPPIESVQPGDLLLVKPGEVVPVDGMIVKPVAVLDESAMTGEARLVERQPGDPVQSGVVNAGGPFDFRAIATADRSTYAGIIRLVQQAQEQKAPFSRLADRYALLFVPVSLAVALLAWFFSGDPVRALAVLVVATPCPLILAAPVAIVSGISQAASRGIIVKGGGALEELARATILLLDKTGTLTTGQSIVSEIVTFIEISNDELLRLMASLDQVSPHVLALAIVREARSRKIELTFPTRVQEDPGSGVSGLVSGTEVALGKLEWLIPDRQRWPARVREIFRRASLEGLTVVFAKIGDKLAGALLIEDPIRIETPRTVRLMRRMGIKRVVTLTGDHPDLAESIGAAIGADEVFSERSPAEKVESVKAEGKRGITVMVGDGINDAPALAAADVGVAMGARGATASSEAADVVLMLDRLDRLADGMRIAKRAYRIATESIWGGMGFSVVAMGFAACGFLRPVAGALVQEVIDVAVILNALRALKSGEVGQVHDQLATDNTERVRHDHKAFMPEVKRLRQVADQLDLYTPERAKKELESVRKFLIDELIPHEKEEDEKIYPVVAKLMGGDDPTGTMSRAHLEIDHLSRLFVQLCESLPPEGLSQGDQRDLRRILYGLNALLTLHFAQEDEHYLALIDERVVA